MSEPRMPASLWVLFLMIGLSLALAVCAGAVGVMLWLIFWVIIFGVIFFILAWCRVYLAEPPRPLRSRSPPPSGRHG
jgi:hypothetical protein